MAGTIRAFIAIPIPDAVAGFLERVQGRLQSPQIKVRWVPAGNIHLTLKFLGDITASKVADIAVRMDAVAAPMPFFRLQARGVGAFPGLRKARVLWVGLAGDIEQLRSIQAGLETGLQALGFEKESRGFRAHLTIGRVRRPSQVPTIGESLAPLQDMASEMFRVDRLALYQSVLKPAGAQYTLLHTSYLKSIRED
jgi:RNA 2',3'-cyclic 3'-phosphodiesterase